MPDRILILGGTKEAATLATKLMAQGHHVITSRAGRTREPSPVEGEVRVGGFGGVEGLATYLQAERIDHLIDATHPFAKQISINAIASAKMANIPLTIKTRPPWKRQKGDQWETVPSLEEAAKIIKPSSRVLLALGSQYLAPFYERDDVFFLVRMVDAPPSPLPFKRHKLLLGKPGATAALERTVLEDNKIDTILCRNSGGKGAYAKIEAARELNMPVIMIER